MRMMLEMSIPVEAGNEAARKGTLGSTMEKILGGLKPEAAYFKANTQGERSGFIVFDMKDTSEIPGIAEKFFLAFNARVTLSPVMNADDLARAIPAIEKVAKDYAKATSA